MELDHHLRLKVSDTVGLIALAIALAALVALVGIVALSDSRGQAQGVEVSASVRSGHGLDEAQQGGVQPVGGLFDRPDGLRP